MRSLFLTLIITVSFLSGKALDLTLKECREMALLTNENIRIAENNVHGSNLDREVARTAYLPQFSGSGNVLYYAPDSKMMDMMTLQLKGTYMAGISLTQPIYTGGKITAANKMASIGEEISKEQLRAVRMDVLADAEKSYWTYIAVLSKVEMMEAYQAMMDSIYETASFAVKTGMSSRQTLLRIETKRSEVVYRLQQAKAGADLCRMALCRVIGVADTVSIVPIEEIKLNPEIISSGTDISNRPEILLLKKNIDIKNQEISMARADFLPTIGMQLGWNAYGNIKTEGWTQDESGNYVPFSSNTKSNGFLGIISVQVPLFHWGEGIKKVKRAKIDVENARLSLERNKKMMELEVNQNYSNVVTGYDLVEYAQVALHEAEENLRIMKEQYEVGLTTLTDLLEAQSQWHSSYSNIIEARTQFKINCVEYLRSIGALE